MKKISVFLMFLGLILGLAVPSFAMKQAVKVQQNGVVGKYLTDTEGMTLYWFKKDEPGKSNCAGSCSLKWPGFYRETVETPDGIAKEDFGTITRNDGENQTTFRGYPLYYWIKDMKAGDTTGNGLKGVWSVVNPDDFPPN